MRQLGRLGFFLGAGLVFLFSLFPCYWALVSSLQPDGELFRTPIRYWPLHPTLHNYELVLSSGTFLTALVNSALVCLSAVGLSIALGALAAFALGRIRFRGRKALRYLLLGMTMFPQIAVLGGLYAMINALGLYNRLPALTGTYLLFTLPFTVWVLTSFFEALPDELEEAATLDGATPMQAFRMVLLPLAAPGLATAGLVGFVMAWNEFLFALSFTQTPDRYTVTRALSSFSGISGSGFELPWGQMMAGTLIVVVPILVLVVLCQRWVIAGLTGGAVKG